MAHITRIAKWESRSNGQVLYMLRVDGDPASDFPVTLDVSIAADTAQLQAKLADAKAKAEALYDASLAAESEAMGMSGQQV